tara:strand:- start:30 stop:338 length:309 start_codon:yes stop_codon:yes gene_type:complete
MSELLKALKNLPPVKIKKHIVNIEGVQHEVSLQLKLEIMRNGEDRYYVDNGKIKLKKIPTKKPSYPVLKTATKGYNFYDNDIHWPVGIVENGKWWKDEYYET